MSIGENDTNRTTVDYRNIRDHMTTLPPALVPSLLPSLADIEAARQRIAPYIPVTPLSVATSISETLGRTVSFKWDNKLRTGSFKERGALNFLLSMDPQARSKGVIAASAGNHALGVSFHANRLSVPCHLVMPVNAPLVKVESCRAFGAKITLHGTLSDSITHAKEIAQKEGTTYLPPFDHLFTVCGQGVAGLELLEQDSNFDSVIIPIGGGGYAAGIATAIKAKRPDVFVLGVCSEWALGARNHIGPHTHPIPPSTIADGIAVKTIGAVTGPILDQHLDSLVAVSERSIAKAIIKLLEHEHVVVEGAGAAGFAALLDGYLPDKYKKPVVMICGSNGEHSLLLLSKDGKKVANCVLEHTGSLGVDLILHGGYGTGSRRCISGKDFRVATALGNVVRGPHKRPNLLIYRVYRDGANWSNATLSQAPSEVGNPALCNSATISPP